MNSTRAQRFARMRQLAAIIRLAQRELDTLLVQEARTALTAEQILTQVPPDHMIDDGLTEAQKIRQWAIDTGHDIGRGGRIPKHIRAAYEAATDPRNTNQQQEEQPA